LRGRMRPGGDAHHGACAVWTAVEVASGELAIAFAIIARGRRRWGRRSGEQSPAESELVGTVAVGEEAVVTDALEAVREGVKQEAADELLGGERHDLVGCVLAIVAPAEADVAILDLDQAAVGDRDAMGVAAQIGEHLLGTPNGRLA
jgi:hypothetical protein